MTRNLSPFHHSRTLTPAAQRALREHGAALNEAETLRALAEWAAVEGNHDVARAHARGAVTLLKQLGAAEDAGAVLLWMEENLLAP
jgi:predicted deacylase